MATEKDALLRQLEARCRRLKREAIAAGFPLQNLRKCLLNEQERKPANVRKWNGWKAAAAFLAFAATVAVALLVPSSWQPKDFYRSLLSQRCLVKNNFLIMEISRPLTDCDKVCVGAKEVVVLGENNVENGSDASATWLYSGRPMVARGMALNWSAVQVFRFQFFKDLYWGVSGALESVDEECQFFPFRTEFLNLKDALSMAPTRAMLNDGEKTWYIGWSNCHPEVSAILRNHYQRPYFLPLDSESSAIDWVFMGWPGPGSSLHLDYVQRPSFQVQVSGKKRWRLVPTPECEHVCGSIEFTVGKGDIVLVDTNQWYHDTFVEPGEMSITIGSEYD